MSERQRKIEVTENEYHDAKFNGHTVRVALHLNRSQMSAMTLSHEEAVELEIRLGRYLDEKWQAEQ